MYRQHATLQRRAQATYDYLLCLAIALGFAAAMIAWWTA